MRNLLHTDFGDWSCSSKILSYVGEKNGFKNRGEAQISF